MLDLMERYSYDDANYIDVVHFNSTVKVGEYRVSTVADLHNAESQLLSNEDYMLMQETPDHFTDDSGNFGVQIRKLIIADLGDVNFSGEFGNFTKKKLIDVYHKIISADVSTSFDKIDAIYPKKSDDVKTYNEKVRKLSNRLLNEVNDRNLGDEATYALQATYTGEDGRLRFNVPLFDPIHASRTQSLLGSLYKNNVIKQKINGGNLVMASSVGFSEDLHINFKDGAVESFDAYLPWWSKNP